MKRIVILVVLIIVVAGGIYFWREYNRKNPDLKEAKADISVNAQSLISEFAANKDAADKKYTGKTIEVKGTIKNIDAETNPAVFVLGDEAEMSTVQCSMDSTHAKDYGSLAKGTAVTMRGIVTGANIDDLLGTDVKLNRCVIVTNK